jgi:hypothetical protein
VPDSIVMNTFDYDLKLAPVALGALLMLLVLGVLFFSLHIHRVMTLQQVDFTLCAYQKTYIAASKCVLVKVRDHLKHPQWQAAQFVCYMLAAIGVGLAAARLAGGQYPVTVPLVGVVSGLLIWVLFRPSSLLALCALLGALLGGAIFHVWAKKRALQPNEIRPPA